MKYDAVFFDLDGTVADTLQNITDALNHTMRHFGRREFAPETVKPHLGWGVDYLMRKLSPEIPEAELDAMLRHYRPYYAAHTTDKVVPYDGILPMMEELRRAGLRLAVISNKPDAAVQPLMERYFRGLLGYSIGEQAGIARKPAPDMLALAAEALKVELSRCLYVGDTEVDIQTARNAGIDCLCVTWGFRSRQQLEAAGAKAITDRPEGIVSYVLSA
jgi:phosphoglycolate phosphatase